MAERLKLLSEHKADMKRVYESSDGIYTSFRDYWNDYMILMKDDNRIVTVDGKKYIIMYDTGRLV